ncbi:MAG: hypothetical protein HRU15_15005, partial [Planctomycetes bacterium]|nr:hypothetical protein [Planctomycetota bacterium]
MSNIHSLYVCCLLSLLCCQLSAVDSVILQAPLTTEYNSQEKLPLDCIALAAVITVPEGAPSDLGVGAFVKDQDGGWFQISQPHSLVVGANSIRFDIDHIGNWVLAVHNETSHKRSLFDGHEYGLYFWSTSQQRTRLHIENLQTISGEENMKVESKQYTFHTLQILHADSRNVSGAVKNEEFIEVQAGERWYTRFMPEDFPVDPYDRAEFSSHLIITDEAHNNQRYPAIFHLPEATHLRRDSVKENERQHAYFELGFRPMLSGRYRVQLHAQWGNKQERMVDLPDLKVLGDMEFDEIEVIAPITMRFPAKKPMPEHSYGIEAHVYLSDGEYEKIGVGAYIIDNQGNWYQSTYPNALKNGDNHLRFSMNEAADWFSGVKNKKWNPNQSFLNCEYGLQFWSTDSKTTKMCIDSLHAVADTEIDPMTEYGLFGFSMSGTGPRMKNLSIGAGQRWQVRFNPHVFPEDPYDKKQFSCDLVVTDMYNQHRRFPAIYHRGDSAWDREGRTIPYDKRNGYYELGFRPMRGHYYLRLEASWNGSLRQTVPLPKLFVSGDKLTTSLELLSPLTTEFAARGMLTARSIAIEAEIHVPDNAPADLGVGACIKDADGRWYQLPSTEKLIAGDNHFIFPLGDSAAWRSVSHRKRWKMNQSIVGRQFGLYFWSSAKKHTEICIDNLRDVRDVVKKETDYSLYNMQMLDGKISDEHLAIECGQRWHVRFVPQIFPSNPYDSTLFSCDLIVTDVTTARRTGHSFPAFFRQPGKFIDRGDHELMETTQAGFFEARFRPKKPGRYQLQLKARWTGGQRRSVRLPDLVVSGAASDPYVYVDAQDSRFFSIGKKNPQFFWPVGMNIRSVTDPRGTARTRSQVTAPRIVHAYEAYLDRFARAGGNCAEIWLSSWNLGLEWNHKWPGFHGLGAYNESNAERIDHLLDYAWARNIRVIFVVHN